MLKHPWPGCVSDHPFEPRYLFSGHLKGCEADEPVSVVASVQLSVDLTGHSISGELFFDDVIDPEAIHTRYVLVGSDSSKPIEFGFEGEIVLQIPRDIAGSEGRIFWAPMWVNGFTVREVITDDERDWDLKPNIRSGAFSTGNWFSRRDKSRQPPEPMWEGGGVTVYVSERIETHRHKEHPGHRTQEAVCVASFYLNEHRPAEQAWGSLEKVEASFFTLLGFASRRPCFPFVREKRWQDEHNKITERKYQPMQRMERGLPHALINCRHTKQFINASLDMVIAHDDIREAMRQYTASIDNSLGISFMLAYGALERLARWYKKLHYPPKNKVEMKAILASLTIQDGRPEDLERVKALVRRSWNQTPPTKLISDMINHYGVKWKDIIPSRDGQPDLRCFKARNDFAHGRMAVAEQEGFHKVEWRLQILFERCMLRCLGWPENANDNTCDQDHSRFMDSSF